MRFFRISLILIGVFFLPAAMWGAPSGGNQIGSDLTVESVRDSLSSQFQRVEDFQVQVHVYVEMPQLRMPRKQIDLAFKQPDLTRIETSGFAVAPRTGLVMSPENLMNNFREILTIEEGMFEEKRHILIHGEVYADSMQAPVQGMSGQEGTVNTKLWIDPHRWVIRRMESRLDTTRFLELSVDYTEVESGIWLPSETEFTFFMPENMQFSGHDAPIPDVRNQGQSTQNSSHGTIRMTFRGYRVNLGLKERFFDRETSKY